VHRDYAVATSDAEARAQRQLVPEVAREADAAHARVGARGRLDLRPRRVLRAVVDEHDLPLLVQCVENGDGAADEPADVLRLVERRGDDAEHQTRVATT